MATLAENLWAHNLTLVRVVDVTDDYRLMQPPMPSDCYPVIGEAWLPAFGLSRRLPQAVLVAGYEYDWHEAGEDSWVVGVVASDLASSLGDRSATALDEPPPLRP